METRFSLVEYSDSYSRDPEARERWARLADFVQACEAHDRDRSGATYDALGQAGVSLCDAYGTDWLPLAIDRAITR